jgi:hypothetical protein
VGHKKVLWWGLESSRLKEIAIAASGSLIALLLIGYLLTRPSSTKSTAFSPAASSSAPVSPQVLGTEFSVVPAASPPVEVFLTTTATVIQGGKTVTRTTVVTATAPPQIVKVKVGGQTLLFTERQTQFRTQVKTQVRTQTATRLLTPPPRPTVTSVVVGPTTTVSATVTATTTQTATATVTATVTLPPVTATVTLPPVTITITAPPPSVPLGP